LPGSIKGNFDVAVCGNFVVATAVLSDPSGEIIFAVTQKLFSSDVLSGEASCLSIESNRFRPCGQSQNG
jgi:hypothetical protein